VIKEGKTRERKYAMMRREKLYPLVVLADVDVVDAPGDVDVELLLEVVDVPGAVLSLETR
jgi:phosphoribosyl-dephospho-CoA transferase